MILYPFQQKILEDTANKNRVAYFLEMGLGKTFIGGEKLYRLSSETNLIVCQKSKIQDWIKHFKENYPNTMIWNLTNKKEFNDFISRYIAWHGFHGASVGIGIINYELAWRRKELLQLEDFTLMLDESSLIQNSKAKQSKFILKLKPSNVILLSGTPTAGRYENLWTQIHLLGWDLKESTYNTQYVNWKRLEIGWGATAKTIPIIDKVQPYKNVERLKSKMREHGAVFMKSEEVLDLPEQVITEIEVNISKEYKAFQRNSIVTVDGVELVGDTELTKRLYSRQLCGQYSEEKLQAFKDLLESTNDRLIVFYNFNDELDKLKAAVDALKRPISTVNGTVKDLHAYEEECDSVTLVQYQAGAMGLNLQKANKVIYFTLPDGRQDLFDQSKKRIHRIGQNNTCFYYLLICRGSVEEDILETLNIRKELTDDLFRFNR